MIHDNNVHKVSLILDLSIKHSKIVNNKRNKNNDEAFTADVYRQLTPLVAEVDRQSPVI